MLCYLIQLPYHLDSVSTSLIASNIKSLKRFHQIVGLILGIVNTWLHSFGVLWWDTNNYNMTHSYRWDTTLRKTFVTDSVVELYLKDTSLMQPLFCPGEMPIHFLIRKSCHVSHAINMVNDHILKFIFVILPCLYGHSNQSCLSFHY